MPRLKNTKTGAVVSVSDEKAARMGGEWEPVEAPKVPAKKATARKPAAKKSE